MALTRAIHLSMPRRLAQAAYSERSEESLFFVGLGLDRSEGCSRWS